MAVTTPGAADLEVHVAEVILVAEERSAPRTCP
jgi:hypothetical protein